VKKKSDAGKAKKPSSNSEEEAPTKAELALMEALKSIR